MDEIKFKLKPVERKPKRGSEKESVMWIVFDTKKEGLETVMRGYTVMAMSSYGGMGRRAPIAGRSGCKSTNSSWRRKGDQYPEPP